MSSTSGYTPFQTRSPKNETFTSWFCLNTFYCRFCIPSYLDVLTSLEFSKVLTGRLTNSLLTTSPYTCFLCLESVPNSVLTDPHVFLTIPTWRCLLTLSESPAHFVSRPCKLPVTHLTTFLRPLPLFIPFHVCSLNPSQTFPDSYGPNSQVWNRKPVTLRRRRVKVCFSTETFLHRLPLRFVTVLCHPWPSLTSVPPLSLCKYGRSTLRSPYLILTPPPLPFFSWSPLPESSFLTRPEPPTHHRLGGRVVWETHGTRVVDSAVTGSSRVSGTPSLSFV